MKRVIVSVAMVGLLAGCGVLDRGRGPTTPTLGERTAVLSTETTAEVDPALAQVPVVVPGPVANRDWPQPGGNAAKSMTHVAFGAAPTQAWRVSIGTGSGPQARLAAEPVVADGKVFTIDTRATVRAFSAANGQQVWQTQVRGEQASSETLFGGGVSYDNGRLYVTNGAGYAAALDANTGGQVWIVRPAGPLRGAPTIAAGSVYVITQDNQIFALRQDTGATQWNGTGAVELAGVFGTAAPAFSQSTVVAGFSSGELTAYRYENGQVVWQDALARTGVSTIVGNLSDIDADPVIDNGRVFAVGQGGRMVAVELVTGQRAWELNIAGISTPWVSGDWVFVVTDRAQLLAVARGSGRIRWISQLQGFREPERRSENSRTGQVTVRPGQGQIFWRGPVLAGGRLVLLSSTGNIVFANPADGAIVQTISGTTPFSLPPVVADGTMYTLDDMGMLTAWR
ncbi:PQQ-binding-like beta-propeller repeat protein [Sphingosinicella sp. YJ22]|uniref:outer membrane protein assembly factor BamB family protein n=1 Tax=Sphingosinicella sp. YJ22 TaxID=1104780 RepID=UPI00140D7AD8|nr:PQQ-binding-like beta-propeller repeat protein [Sphingosinicella sp. YJ22]